MDQHGSAVQCTAVTLPVAPVTWVHRGRHVISSYLAAPNDCCHLQSSNSGSNPDKCPSCCACSSLRCQILSLSFQTLLGFCPAFHLCSSTDTTPTTNKVGLHAGSEARCVHQVHMCRYVYTLLGTPHGGFAVNQRKSEGLRM